jgi:hypothetical protein
MSFSPAATATMAIAQVNGRHRILVIA